MSKYRTIIAQLMCVMVLISGCAAQSGSGDQTNQSDTNSTESAAAEDVDNADGSAADGGAGTASHAKCGMDNSGHSLYNLNVTVCRVKVRR